MESATVFWAPGQCNANWWSKIFGANYFVQSFGAQVSLHFPMARITVAHVHFRGPNYSCTSGRGAGAGAGPGAAGAAGTAGASGGGGGGGGAAAAAHLLTTNLMDQKRGFACTTKPKQLHFPPTLMPYK